MNEFIKLQHAHVNQHTTNGLKTDWKIEENKTNNFLGVLPSRLDHNEVFSILDFARKFELDAFNIGIDFGKKQAKIQQDMIKSEYESRLSHARIENERLAEALEKLTNNN